jgi:uncharacterized protein
VIELNEKNGAVTFRIRVQPRAARSEMAGEYAGALKLRIAAPPVDGKANEEVIRFLAKLFSIANRQIEILGGDTSRDKIIRIHNVSVTEIRGLLGI